MLDIPQRVLTTRTRGQVRTIRMGENGLHGGIERVLAYGMRRPGQAFGHRTFNFASQKTLSKYISKIRKAIGDAPRGSRFIHFIDVENALSDTHWGFVLDARWTYLVIEG